MKSIAAIVALLCLLVFLHITAVHFYFYWTIWWFDIFMHILGGFIGGFLVIAILDAGTSPLTLLASVIAVSCILGIAWEAYEHVTGMTFVSTGFYAVDTISDLLSDIAGAMIAFLFVHKPLAHAIEP